MKCIFARTKLKRKRVSAAVFCKYLNINLFYRLRTNVVFRFQLDGEKETLEHIICTCPVLARTRISLLGWLNIRDLAEVSKWDMRKLIAFARKSGMLDLNDLRP